MSSETKITTPLQRGKGLVCILHHGLAVAMDSAALKLIPGSVNQK